MSKVVSIVVEEIKEKEDAILSSLLEAFLEKGKIALLCPVENGKNTHFYSKNSSAKHIQLFTQKESVELHNIGEDHVIYEKCVEKIAELRMSYDTVICLHICSKGVLQEFNEKLAKNIANTLSAPIIDIMNMENASVEDIKTALLVREASYKEECSMLLYTIGFGCILNQQEIQEIEGFYALRSSAKNIVCLSESEELQHSFSKKIVDCVKKHTKTMTNPIHFEMQLSQKAKEQRQRIVLPEGEEPRILQAAAILLQQEIAYIILLGNVDKIKMLAEEMSLDLRKATIIDPIKSPYYKPYVASYMEARKHKGITEEVAKEKMKDPSYFGTMMVQESDADGMVSGAINTTANTIRPALEFIKTKEGCSLVSSIFFMCFKDKVLLFGDCAVNPNPTPEQLAEIAITSAETAKSFGIEPKIAMLSYSTGTSGSGPDVEMVKEATALVRSKAPELLVEGPIQFDAAIDINVAKTKLPNSTVAGQATVLVFPDLNTGNNTYKGVQRAGNLLAIGPLLQGLRKPVNDLSRGCTVADIINTVSMTAIQAQKK